MLNIETRVYSRLANKFPSNLRDKYPNTNFTRDDRVLNNPKFPCVYVHELPSVEQGQDLQNNDICAVMASFQIEVYDDKSMDNAKKIMDYVVETMKSMRFSIISMPEFKNTDSTYRQVARFRRLVASLDKL